MRLESTTDDALHAETAELEAPKPDTATISAAQPPPTEVQEVAEAEEGPTEPVTTALPPSVRPGTWFEIHPPGQRVKRRLKLSTILLDTGEVLFSSRTGEEALTLPLDRFLEDLRSGRSRPIEDTNRFEEALQAVIRNRVVDRH